ncbi:MAG TPA: Chromate resistance protein ChrB, partial [Microlunatus sp.]|nr:Chromate resistance protein ChrB [Microlunatus sp.]
ARWVLLAYRVPRVPSTPRIAVWRKLRALGVAQIGDGLVALPEDARTREQLEWVAADVDAAGGSAILWLGELLSAADEQRLVAQLQQARAEEYRALMVQAEQRQAVDRLRRELRRIRRRDYYPPPEQELARRAVDALAVQSGEPTSTGTGGARP